MSNMLCHNSPSEGMGSSLSPFGPERLDGDSVHVNVCAGALVSVRGTTAAVTGFCDGCNQCDFLGGVAIKYEKSGKTWACVKHGLYEQVAVAQREESRAESRIESRAPLSSLRLATLPMR